MTNMVAISAAASSQILGLAARADGTVVAWGDNPYGETNPPAALTNLLTVAVAAAPNHGLALVNDGSPLILHPPVGLTSYTGRDVILRASAAGAQPLSYQWLLNGTNVPGATNASLFLSNIQLSNAGNYQLFVSNSVNTALSLAAPLTVINDNTLTFLSQPASQTNYQGGKVQLGAAVLGSGPLNYQWYYSNMHAPVIGATNDSLTLEPVMASQTGNYWVSVTNNVRRTYSWPFYVRVLFAKAWGYLATDPPLDVTNATAIAVGNLGQNTSSGHYLVLKSDGKIYAWSGGDVHYGETNVAALNNSTVTAIAAGYGDSLALKSDGTVYAWGDNLYGETNVPAGLSGVTAIACGDYHDLALKSDGTVVGWGQNTYSQTTNAAATNVVAIAAGGQNSIALRADGSVVTWGNFGGAQSKIPSTATNVIAVAAGAQHFLALRADGTVVQWGGLASYPVPAGLSNVVAISAAAIYSTALRADGSVTTWNYYFGNNIAAPYALANVIAIASGGDHNLALFGARAPAFTVQPWDRTIASTARINIILAAKCAGVQPVYYQWQLNGTNIPGATNDTLVLTNQPSQQFGPVRFIPTGAYQLVASNAYGVVASKYAKVTTFIPLGDALNATNLNWTTSGNAPWFGETDITHDGVFAARSGGIGASQETILQTTHVTNAHGILSFWWKVSSEQYFDILEFRINGVTQTSISGEVDWTQVSVPLPAGTNVLQWRYSKDPTFDVGLDAGFVDQVSFVVAPVITQQPASITANYGDTIYLSVWATGSGPMGYQWIKNGKPFGNSSALTLGNVGRFDDGIYSVTVTNAAGAAVSSDALVQVIVPQHLGTPTLLANGSLQLTSLDAGGNTVTLTAADLTNFEAQVSTNLVKWVTLTNALSLTNGTLQLQDIGSTNSRARFYRILEH
jgi:hypothetical protein